MLLWMLILFAFLKDLILSYDVTVTISVTEAFIHQQQPFN